MTRNRLVALGRFVSVRLSGFLPSCRPDAEIHDGPSDQPEAVVDVGSTLRTPPAG